MGLILGLGIWIAVILVLVLLFVILLGEKYFQSPGLMGFESRTELIRSGLWAVVVSGAAFFFLPLTVLQFDTASVKVNLTQLLGSQAASLVPKEVETTVDAVVQQSVNQTVTSVKGMAQQLFLYFAGLATLLVAVGVVVIIIQTREEMTKKKTEYSRKSLFEYREDIFEKVNKGFIGR